MKTPKETARRWLAQAEHSLVTTRVLLENGLWADACFHSEQTAQLALKAFLYWRGRRFVNIHSIRALALECGKEYAQFLAFESYGIILDRYYLGTRYPDVLPAPAIPFESFTQQEAHQALGYATEIVELVRTQIPT
jgi:HEPN domain-containing protein